MTAGAPNSGDVELGGGSATAPPPPPPDENGGPNAPHPSDPDPDTGAEHAQAVEEARAADEAAAAAAEEEDEPTWPAEDDPSAQTAPSPDEPAEPSSETQTDPPSSGVDSEPAAPTGEAGGGDGEEPTGEPPEPAEPESRSGAATRPYTFLEEQEVVPMHLLTEAQKKSLQKHATTGFVERDDKVVARNTEAALNQVYDEDGQPEHVSRVLTLSERSFQPVVLDLEPVQRSRLRIRK